MKALKIDVANRQVVEIEMDGSLECIYKHIGNGCELFSCPVEFENNDALYTDDEGLLQPEMLGGFMFREWRYMLVGNALIQGTDSEGDSVDCLSTPVEIMKRIIWFTPAQAEAHKQNICNL